MAIAYTADVAWTYVKVHGAIEDRATVAAAVPGTLRLASDQGRSYEPKNPERELAFAQTTIYRIAFPWNNLFKALGSSGVDEVSLLGVEPDVDGGTVEVTGEAKNFPALLTYVAYLEGNDQFRAVNLTRHEIRRNDPRRPVFFSVTVAWKGRP
ncbi:MAG: PilN domain-containing protein [Rhodocyclales bacterium]|nr:PilN domain-containing protein [Rhodocyclales bacterium]